MNYRIMVTRLHILHEKQFPSVQPIIPDLIFHTSPPLLNLIQLLNRNILHNEPLSAILWIEIIHFAKKMHLMPLLYSSIKNKEDIFPPPDIYIQLKSFYRENAVRNLSLTYSLRILLTEFEKNNIRAIPLKGIYLANCVYDNPSARQMNDLDIMVRWKDVPDARNIVEKLGFKASDTCHLDNTYRRTKHHAPDFLHPSGTRVEIHWNILSPNGGNRGKELEDMIWLHTVPGEILGKKTLFLKPELSILHSTIHLTFLHMFNSGIRDIYDIDSVYRKFRGTIDWDFLVSFARRFRFERALHLVLALTDIITGSDTLSELKKNGLYLEIPNKILIFAANEIIRGGSKDSLSIKLLTSNPGPFATTRALVNWLFPGRDEMRDKYHVPPGHFGVYRCYPMLNYHRVTHFNEIVRDYSFGRWMNG
ncbi:MAG TPA: nucleotidyltransferase family protein [Methanolinea sp.]|nr:nucleotidyltransferase family protein [Methanolinea sp.]